MSQAKVMQLLKEGILAARAGNKGLTRQLLNEAIVLDPHNETAWMWLAGVAETPLAAYESLRCVLRINPKNEKAQEACKSTRLQAGFAALKALDKKLAWTLLSEAVQLDPKNESAWLALAASAATSEAAIECLQKVLTLNPTNARAAAGIEYYRGQSVATAPPTAPPAAAWSCPLCATTADAAPTKCRGCGSLLELSLPATFASHTGVNAQKLNDAIEHLTGIDQAEAEYDTYYHLALAFLNLQRWREAQRELESALALKPRSPAIRAFLELLKRHVTEEEEAARRAEEAAQASRKIVLVVDDSPTVRKLVALTLERRGFRVFQAEDGYKAIEVLRQQGYPHLILLDITMPEMDGYQLCRLLRQNRETAKLPIIMLSGKDGFFNKIRGRMAGCTEYLTKPFEPSMLAETVEGYLGVAAATLTRTS